LEGLPGGVRRVDSGDVHQARAVVYRARGQQVVFAAGGVGGDCGDVEQFETGISGGGQGEEEGVAAGAEIAGERVAEA